MTLEMVDRVRRRLAEAQVGRSVEAAVAVADEAAGSFGGVELVGMLRDVESELSGAGPLDPLLRLTGVTDVLVNGPEEVWIERGKGLERTAVRFVLPVQHDARAIVTRS